MKLIIKGANFASNSIPSESNYVSSEVVQGGMTTNPERTDFGKFLTTGFGQNFGSTKILVQAGKELDFFVLYQNAVESVYITCVASVSDIKLVNNADLKTDDSDLLNRFRVYPVSKTCERENDKHQILQNDTNEDLYYYISFNSNGGLTGTYDASTRSVFYKLNDIE